MRIRYALVLLLLPLSVLHATTMRSSTASTIPAESRWQGQYKLEFAAPVENVAYSEGEASLLHQATLSYDLGYLKLAVKPSVLVDYDLAIGSAKNTMGNTILEAKKDDVFSLGSAPVEGKLRYYIPTGEKFRDSGTKGMFYASAKVKTPVYGRFGVEYEVVSKYYMQSQRALVKYDDLGRILSTPKATKSFVLENDVAATFSLLKGLTVFQKFGLDHGWLYEDPGVGVQSATETEFKVSTGLKYKIGIFDFQASLKQKHATDDENGYAIYASEETSYYFEMEIKI